MDHCTVIPLTYAMASMYVALWQYDVPRAVVPNRCTNLGNPYANLQDFDEPQVIASSHKTKI